MINFSSSYLLKYFEQVAEAPDAIPRLRRFILDLAVRGKLVEQDPNDEPASELLNRIETEKNRLVKTDALRTQSTQLIDKEQIPFNIPTNWSWTQLSQIGVINPRNESTDSKNAAFIPMPMIFAEYGKAHQHEVRPWGEIKKGFTHFAEGDVGLAKITPCFENGKSTVFRNLTGGLGAGTTELHIVRPIYIVPDYILIFLKSSHFIETGIPKMTGTAGQKRVSKDYFAFSPFPLPPLAEQKKIVAKVDELMTLSDELEKAQAKRESRRDRLVAATLHGLNNGDANSEPDTSISFSESALFYFNQISRLTTRPEHIKQLRQTILNLAVRGKLVPQNPKDEPAADLLKKIKTEKIRMVQEGRVRNQQSLPSIMSEDYPFDLPKTWEWLRLGDIGFTQTGTTPSSNNHEYFGYYIPFIKPADLNGNAINYSGEGISKEGVEHSRLIPKHSVLMVCIGSSIGKVNVTDMDICCNQQINTVTPYLEPLTAFTSFALKSFYFQKLVVANAGMGTLPIISKGKWEILPIPLPPLAEQHRIVAKVGELMAMCDELETQLTSTTATRRQLLEATLHEALQPSF